MPRLVGKDDRPLYRAVVVETRTTVDSGGAHASGEFVTYYGPFTEKGQATATITRERRQAERHNIADTHYIGRSAGESRTHFSISGHVEVSRIEWKKIDDTGATEPHEEATA